MLPVPVPDGALARVSQSAVDETVHGQAACVVTTDVSSAAGMQGVKSTGATEYWQLATLPRCVIVAVRPAIVMVAIRSGGARFASTRYVRLPLPVPGPGAVTMTQGALLDALHGHPAAVVTAMVPVPPSSAYCACSGSMLYVQLGTTGVPSCVTVTDCPATVITPDRAVGLPFAVPAYLTWPGPVPDVAAGSVSHVLFDWAVHAHALVVVTVMSPLPPDATIDAVSGDTA